MKSVNYPLRKGYMALLDGMVVNTVSIPVYYQRLPESASDENYILLTGLTNNDVGTFNSSDTESYIQVQIHTKDGNANSGQMADDVANAVFAEIYPDPQFNIDLSADNLQCISTSLSSDQTMDQIDAGNETFQTRVLTFKHIIYHK